MIEDIFDSQPLFQDLNPGQRDLLRPLFTPCDCYSETVIFEQGDPTEYLYLVVIGEITIHYKPDDAPSILVSRVLATSFMSPFILCGSSVL